VTLSVSGSPGDFRTTLESDPPLPESDVVSVLVTGRTLAESGEEARQGAQNQALGLVSTELLASAGGDLGLEVRVGEESGPGGRILFDSSLVANDLDPTTRLTVGRQLSEQITLIASQNLRDSELAWIVDYFPRDNIEIRGLFSGDNERAYEFRHALEMGHPPPRTETLGDRPSATTLRRVDRVMFTGSTGFLIDELQDVIRLRAGDRFDFFRWQDDQDRLEQFYRSRGYREVRLRARRTESPSSVSLEYDIVQGPSTAFVIDGYDAPSSLRRAVGEAWERSVLDAFLLDEVRALAREHLDRRGFLQATVEAIMDASQNPPQKTLTVSVGTGPRTTEREVVFHGNDQRRGRTRGNSRTRCWGCIAASAGLKPASSSNRRCSKI
jgi:hypothetical protein